MQINMLRGFSVFNTVKKYRFTEKTLQVFTGQLETNSAHLNPLFHTTPSAQDISTI